MKIISLADGGKQGAVVIKTAFFRGKMKKHRADRWRYCAPHAPVTWQKIERHAESAARNVTELLNSVHTLFTLTIPLLPASGVRLETARKTDKQKSELYF